MGSNTQRAAAMVDGYPPRRAVTTEAETDANRQRRIAGAIARAAGLGSLSPAVPMADVVVNSAVERRQRERTTPASARRVAVVWAALGFVVGIVFWHLIGFWGFVQTIVLPPGAPERVRASEPVAGSGEPAMQSTVSLPARPTRPRFGAAPVAGAKRSNAWAATVIETAAEAPVAPGLTDR